jgi:hypothetical protein
MGHRADRVILYNNINNDMPLDSDKNTLNPYSLSQCKAMVDKACIVVSMQQLNNIGSEVPASSIVCQL